RRARGVGDVVRRAEVDRLAGAETEHRSAPGVVGVERHLLLERHALLLRYGEQRTLLPVRPDGVDGVAVHHHGDLLVHRELLDPCERVHLFPSLTTTVVMILSAKVWRWVSHSGQR